MKEHNYKFVQPVSMQVNQEQFDYLKPKLEAMGYKGISITRLHGDCIYIATNYIDQWTFSNVVGNVKNGYNRHFIDHYNPELFLAIAAMTDAEYGIKGENWVCISSPIDTFTENKVYKANKPINNYGAFINNNGSIDGFGEYGNFKKFKKATVPELISHYTKTKTDMSTTRNVAFTLEQAKALYEKDKEQYAWLLPTFPELEQPIKWHELKSISGFSIEQDCSICARSGTAAYNDTKNIYYTEAQARGALAQSMITQLLPVYNGADWVLDLADGEFKHFIVLNRNGWILSAATSEALSMLSFETQATAERFLAEQTELLEQYKGLFIEPKKS